MSTIIKAAEPGKHLVVPSLSSTRRPRRTPGVSSCTSCFRGEENTTSRLPSINYSVHALHRSPNARVASPPQEMGAHVRLSSSPRPRYFRPLSAESCASKNGSCDSGQKKQGYSGETGKEDHYLQAHGRWQELQLVWREPALWNAWLPDVWVVHWAVLA